jgi:UDP-4-amino-4,6-dideoxy-N-acetyl-beta-L-altrosamine N-acetyltransferase
MSNNYLFKNFIELNPRESSEVLEGRNEEWVRKWMISDREISMDEHLKFIDSLRESDDQIYFRIEYRGNFVGVYSLININDRSGIGGFWIGKYARDRLLGLSIVYHSINYIFSIFAINKILGYQLKTNTATARLNAALGFVVVPEPTESDIRMQYLELGRECWERNSIKNSKLLKLIEISERENEK